MRVLFHIGNHNSLIHNVQFKYVKIFFCYVFMKIKHKLWGFMEGLKLYDFHGFQSKS